MTAAEFLKRAKRITADKDKLQRFCTDDPKMSAIIFENGLGVFAEGDDGDWHCLHWKGESNAK
jgi:hypothetical protein